MSRAVLQCWWEGTALDMWTVYHRNANGPESTWVDSGPSIKSRDPSAVQIHRVEQANIAIGLVDEDDATGEP